MDAIQATFVIKTARHFVQDEQGATLVEYALIVGLLSLVVAVVVGGLGQATVALYERIGNAPF